jgi:hypothetical protein
MAGGSLAAARLWAATDIRSRWKALVAVGVIAGLTAGLALAAVAGARRTDTALDRLRERTNASDAIVFASQRGVYHPDWTVLGRRPEVRALAPWGLVFGNLAGDPEGLFFTPVDDIWMQDVDAPLIVEGRSFDPQADDELLVAEGLAASEGIHVGDTIPFTPYTVDEEEGAPPPLKGPALTMRVVGIMRTPLEELFIQDGFVVASPGIIDRHPDVSYFENAFVQLVDPDAGTGELEAHATADITPGVPLLDLHVVARRVTATTDVQRSALLLLAGAIALAGLVLAGQVVSRSASFIGRDARTLEAVGMRRSSVAAAALLSHLPAVVVAAATAIVTAGVTSRWLPFGLARRLEPDRGVHLDAVVLVPGVLLLVVAVVVGVLVSARAAGRRDPAAAGRAVGITEWVRRHASVPVGIGTTLAFRRGGGRAIPVRPALLGAVVGVLGIAGAITLDAGLTDALDHPERAGVAWDGQVYPGTPETLTELGFAPAFVRDIEAVPGITNLVQVDRASVPVDAIGTPGFSLRPFGSAPPIHLVTLDGRGPERRGEVAVGPDTLETLGLGIGDAIHVGDPAQTMTVVGVVLFPSEVHAGFDQGVWLWPDDYDAVAGAAEEDDVERWVAVRFADGSEASGLAALRETAERHQASAGPADIPPELLNLRDVRPLPRLLAAFLALLALAALLHVLVTTTRVRAHEFAVLRALGLTRWGTRIVINVQGTALFLLGLLLGTPVGVAAGRVGWRLIAERVPLDDASPMAAVALALLLPSVLMVAQVIAYGPGRLVGRLRTAEVLRTE